MQTKCTHVQLFGQLPGISLASVEVSFMLLVKFGTDRYTSVFVELLPQLKIRLTLPSLNRAGAELGNIY